MGDLFESAKATSLVAEQWAVDTARDAWDAAKERVAAAEEALAQAEEDMTRAEESGDAAAIRAAAAALAAASAEVSAADVAADAAAAAFAAASEALAIAAAAITLAMALEQVGAAVIDWFWDPTAPLYPLGSPSFTGVNDLEIDAFCRRQPYRVAAPHRLLAIDKHFPQLGSLLLKDIRHGVRMIVDAVQGAAAATVKDKAGLKAAADAFKKDLKESAASANEVADAVDYYRPIKRRLRTYTLSDAEAFINRARTQSLGRLVDMEGMLVQEALWLARVRSPQDLRPEIYSWIAQGLGKTETDAFKAAKYQTLAASDLMRVHAKCLSSINLSRSPLLK